MMFITRWCVTTARISQGKIKKKYAIDDERQAVRDALATWMSGAVKDQPFAGGERPNMADVCVFGARDLDLNLNLNLDMSILPRGHVLNLSRATWTGALKGIDRTDAHAEIMAESSIGVAAWYDRMHRAVQPRGACVQRE